MNLSSILKTLATPTLRSSADLRADLAKIDITAIEGRANAIERQRRALLLSGSDEDLAENIAVLAAVRLDAERAQALIDELQRQIAAAEEREAAQRLEAEADEARQAEKRLAATYVEIDTLAEKMTELFAAASASAKTLARWNARAEKIKRPDLLIAYAEPAIAKQRLVGTLR